MRYRSIFAALLAGMAATDSASASQLSKDAPVLFSFKISDSYSFDFTNSMLVLLVCILLIIAVVQIATRKMAIIPDRLQNFVELVVEALFNFFKGNLGERLARRTFWWFGAVFITILSCNLMGLIPGTGMIKTASGAPLMRGPNADMNLTFALAIMFSLLWVFWSVREIGVKGVLSHLFVPQGVSGMLKIWLLPVFLFVGLLEVVSISLRNITLSARLYGNIFAGENVLEVMAHMVKNPLFGWMPVLPFLAMELLVAFIQTLVFTMLCSIFLGTMCSHHDDEEHAHDEQGAKH